MGKDMDEQEKKSNEVFSKILLILKERFEQHMSRHEGVSWKDVENYILKKPKILTILSNMEKTGGEPDVVLCDKNSQGYFFFDCAKESPKGRRSLCYDGNARKERKENKPQNSAIEMAMEIGIEILTEKQYRLLESFGEFDTKTSSWVKTPDNIRKLGGAIFCDRRYDSIFTYHNGAESYYSSRGFRGVLKV
jgi:hypothetical protein